MINQASILGRVGRIDTKQLPQGGQVTNISMVTSKKYVKDGQKVEKVMWHNITLFSKLSEIADKYVAVGDLLWIQGEMCSEKYIGRDGQERSKFYVIGHELKLIPKGSGAPRQEAQTAAPAGNPFEDDAIPF